MIKEENFSSRSSTLLQFSTAVLCFFIAVRQLMVKMHFMSAQVSILAIKIGLMFLSLWIHD